MQTCGNCNGITPDSASNCQNCGSNLEINSQTAKARKRLIENTRVTSVRLSAHEDACPTCQQFHRTFAKDEMPVLPIMGCSNAEGCRCFYEPVLADAALISKQAD